MHLHRFYKKERKKFSDGLTPSFVTDNKLFWKTVKPFFSDKGNYGANIGWRRGSFAKWQGNHQKVKWVL